MTVLGIDTSNYTTSVALVENGSFRHVRELLEVAPGERGLRQSDALFLHVKNLPRLMEKLGSADISAVAYSSRPRSAENSYMPCFLAGEAVARGVAAARGVPAFAFSHQAGHIEAAAQTCGAKMKPEFLAFHLSGGTTEILFAERDKKEGWLCKIIGHTLDISAGQLIDRGGVAMGLKFPCGSDLEALALLCDEKLPKIKINLSNGSCNLSGMENKISKMLSNGVPREYVARYVIEAVGRTVCEMTRSAREKFPSADVLFAGGVMKNSIIRQMLAEEFENIYFSSSELSSDNAVGTAYLGYRALSEN